jgi:YgiT-type zinc finger domain-containing protein
MMQCALCRDGELAPGEVTVTLQRGDTTVIVKQVPADVCGNCGDYFLSEAIAARVFDSAEEAVARGAEVEILRFAA